MERHKRKQLATFETQTEGISGNAKIDELKALACGRKEDNSFQKQLLLTCINCIIALVMRSKLNKLGEVKKQEPSCSSGFVRCLTFLSSLRISILCFDDFSILLDA